MFTKGAWKVCCDRCGVDKLSFQLRQEWTGQRVCSDCYDIRHPQDMVRGKADRQAPPWVRPEPPEINLTTNQVRPEDL